MMKKKAYQTNKDLKDDDDGYFTKSGKVKSTYICAHKFNESCIGRIKIILNRIESAISSTKCLREKHQSMYPGMKQKQTSLKRRKKENLAKSKKGKQERHETQMKRVYNLVANNTPDGHFSLLNYTGISEVKKGDIK